MILPDLCHFNLREACILEGNESAPSHSCSMCVESCKLIMLCAEKVHKQLCCKPKTLGERPAKKAPKFTPANGASQVLK